VKKLQSFLVACNKSYIKQSLLLLHLCLSGCAPIWWYYLWSVSWSGVSQTWLWCIHGST